MGIIALLKKLDAGRRPVVRTVPAWRLCRQAVKPDNTPFYVKRGWTKTGNRYQGYYRTKYGAWQGGIERRGDKFKVNIIKPPIEQIKNHPRWACFHEGRGGRWRIELAINPKDGDVGAIIFYVERIVVESFNKWGQKCLRKI